MYSSKNNWTRKDQVNHDVRVQDLGNEKKGKGLSLPKEGLLIGLVQSGMKNVVAKIVLEE
jgi:hypothetical protein